MALPEPWSWSRLWSRLPKFSKRALLGGVILLGLGTALGFTTPRATVGESTRGLVQIAPSGLASSITRVTFHYGSQKVALRLEAGQWVPVHRVPAGIWGTVQIHLAGPKIVSWLPFFGHRLRTEKIITPAVPAITHTARARSLAGGVAVTFAHPAVQVRYRWEGQVRIRTWKISLGRPGSNSHLEDSHHQGYVVVAPDTPRPHWNVGHPGARSHLGTFVHRSHSALDDCALLIRNRLAGYDDSADRRFDRNF
ncbi:MAG: hypothetical protein M1415_04340 [Firmicutes bacterium]|nr:hypothetical protein [Bacillota bacterium]